MRKFAILALSFVLTASLMAACRGNSDTDTTGSTAATTQPTTAATTPSTAATKPSTIATNPSETGMLEDGMIDGTGDAGSKSGRTGRFS